MWYAVNNMIDPILVDRIVQELSTFVWWEWIIVSFLVYWTGTCLVWTYKILKWIILGIIRFRPSHLELSSNDTIDRIVYGLLGQHYHKKCGSGKKQIMGIGPISDEEMKKYVRQRYPEITDTLDKLDQIRLRKRK